MERPPILFSLLTKALLTCTASTPTQRLPDRWLSAQETLAGTISVTQGSPDGLTIPSLGVKLHPRLTRPVSLTSSQRNSRRIKLASLYLSSIAYLRVTKLGVSDTRYVDGTRFLPQLKHHLGWDLQMNNKEMSFQTQFSKQAPENIPPPPFAFCWTPSPWKHHNRLNKSSEES